MGGPSVGAPLGLGGGSALGGVAPLLGPALDPGLGPDLGLGPAGHDLDRSLNCPWGARPT